MEPLRDLEENTTTPQPAPHDGKTPPEGLFSESSFEDLELSPELLEAIAGRGYTLATPVQARCIPLAVEERDLIVRSKTGTGKTAAFGIPLVEMIGAGGARPRGLVLAPTRELALQGAQEIEALGAVKGLRVCSIYGGASMQKQIDALEAGVDIVVGTPGRIIDQMRRGHLDLSEVRHKVLDEADEMLSMGFLEDVRQILGACPADSQTLLFSATVSEDIEGLIKRYTHEPETILLTGDDYSVDGIDNILYETRSDYPKPRNLLYLVEGEQPAAAIVFCNTRDDTSLVAAVLSRNGWQAEILNSDLSQKERERVMKRVKTGELRFMVATDLAARGIDITGLTHVINYSLPEDPLVYMHRVGRTGRIGRGGTAISLMGGRDLATLSVLEKRFGVKFERRKLPDADHARRNWTDRHIGELKKGMEGSVFEAFLPLVRDIKSRPDGEFLLAHALSSYFGSRRPKLRQETSEDARREERRESRSGSSSGDGRGKSRGRGRRDRDDARREPSRPRDDARAEPSRPRDDARVEPSRPRDDARRERDVEPRGDRREGGQSSEEPRRARDDRRPDEGRRGGEGRGSEDTRHGESRGRHEGRGRNEGRGREDGRSGEGRRRHEGRGRGGDDPRRGRGEDRRGRDGRDERPSADRRGGRSGGALKPAAGERLSGRLQAKPSSGNGEHAKAERGPDAAARAPRASAPPQAKQVSADPVPASEKPVPAPEKTARRGGESKIEPAEPTTEKRSRRAAKAKAEAAEPTTEKRSRRGAKAKVEAAEPAAEKRAEREPKAEAEAAEPTTEKRSRRGAKAKTETAEPTTEKRSRRGAKAKTETAEPAAEKRAKREPKAKVEAAEPTTEKRSRRGAKAKTETAEPAAEKRARRGSKAAAKEAAGPAAGRRAKQADASSLVVNLGSGSGLDAAGVRDAVCDAAGADQLTVVSTDVEGTRSVLHCRDADAARALLAANGRKHGRKVLKVEAAGTGGGAKRSRRRPNTRK